MPLSTYENIIPQRGEIVKRLTAVFKKNSGIFLFGRRAFFYAEFRVGYHRGTKVVILCIQVNFLLKNDSNLSCLHKYTIQDYQRNY